MNKVAVIGGSGFYDFPELGVGEQLECTSAYSDSPLTINQYSAGNWQVYFIARHGATHHCPPHRVNYRANIDVLAQLGVKHVLAVNAVGGIAQTMGPGCLVLPDQIIDYTFGREHTFFDEFNQELGHIDFSQPLQSKFRKRLFNIFSQREIKCVNGGVYGCMQGPRLETAAEIKKLKRDGCDLVGMTVMPEACLAREKNMSYLSICIVCNWAAGISDIENDKNEVAPLSVDDMQAVLAEKITKVRSALMSALTLV